MEGPKQIDTPSILSEEKSSTGVIFFNHEEASYGFLSNTFLSSFEIEGKVWPAVENYYQAKKYPGSPEVQE